MLKKVLLIFSIILFYLIFAKIKILAKEYCTLYQNEELIETIELPFYFYENSLNIKMNNSWPEQIYNSSHTFIDSSTKCESIKKTVSSFKKTPPFTISVYDYSKTIYQNLTNKQIYENSKLKKENTTIKGYSNIKDEEAPVFEGYNKVYTTNVDNPINLSLILKNISSYDNRDGIISRKIQLIYTEYKEDLKKIGTFPVILSVEDSSANKSSITFHIEVIDTTPPLIEGKNTYTSYLSSPLKLEEIKKELKAIDNVDKDLTHKIYVCDDTYTFNENKPGKYTLYFCAKDFSNNSSSPHKIIIEVKDDIPPVIEGLNHYTSYLSNPLTTQEILYSLAASDNHTDISSSIFIVHDYYSTYLNTLGEKKIIFQAMDSSNNVSSSFTVTIELIDDIKPQIFGLNTYTSYLSNPLSLSYLKQQLSVLDNFDGNISSKLETIEDTYTPNINKLGTYHITFKAIDYSNNESETFKINITNIDDVAPSINGPNSLKYPIKEKPTLTDILYEFKAYDNIDTNIELVIDKDNYSSSLTTGTYYITLSCIDSSNNKSIPFTTKIELVDILLNLNQISISLPTSKLYTIEEINKIINLTVPYIINQNTYSPNYQTQGNYMIEYELEDHSKILLTINTYKQNQEETKLINKQKKETLLSKIKSFFINIFIKIKKLLKNIFSLYIFSKH